jgi:hypothetical protein
LCNNFLANMVFDDDDDDFVGVGCCCVYLRIITLVIWYALLDWLFDA